MTKFRHSLASTLFLAFLAFGNTRFALSMQSEIGVIVTAKAPLDPIEESHRLVAEMESRAMQHAETSSINFGTMRVHTSASEIDSPIRRVSTDGGYQGHKIGDAVVLRTEKTLEAVVLARGLRAGAYTMWWVVFNNPDRCTEAQPAMQAQCGGGDGSDLQMNDVSILWASGAVVKRDGIGLFHADTELESQRKYHQERYARRSAAFDQDRAEIHLVVKYNGSASGDIDELSRQLTTVPDACGSEYGAVNLDAFTSHCNEVGVAVSRTVR